MKKLNNKLGYTLIELLVALMITSVLSTASYSFYIRMHNSTITQQEISDMQQNSRNCLHELTQTLRKAGFKTGAHPAYTICSDSLYVFFSETQPIDTVLYYLTDYSDYEIATLSQLPEGHRPKKLMRKVNSGAAAVYSDMVTSVTYSVPSSSSIEITLVTQVARPDEDFSANRGVRTSVATERVTMRNVNL